MIRKLMAARRQKKAQAAFARKWMAIEPKRKPRPARWVRRWDDPQPKGLMARMRASWAIRIAAGGTGAMMATGGMAYAGVLPDPVQRVVSNVAEKAGLHVPSPDDEQVVDAGEGSDKGSETSRAVREVTRNKKNYDKGPGFGKAVSGAAHRANEQKKAAKDEDSAASKGKGHAKKDNSGDDGSKPVPPGQVDKVHPVKDEEGKNASRPPVKSGPGKPEHPVKPDAPEKPAKPAKPSKPAKPEKPSGDVERPEEVEPEEPSEPVEEKDPKDKPREKS